MFKLYVLQSMKYIISYFKLSVNNYINYLLETTYALENCRKLEIKLYIFINVKLQ